MNAYEPSLIDRRYAKARAMYYKYAEAEKRVQRLKAKYLRKLNYYTKALAKQNAAL